MKNAPRDSMVGMYTYMIPLTNIGYGILTSKVIRGHWRSLDVKKRSNFKNASMDSIFGMHTFMISLTHIGYGVFTPKVIRGHKTSLKVKKWQIWKSDPECIFLYI